MSARSNQPEDGSSHVHSSRSTRPARHDHCGSPSVTQPIMSPSEVHVYPDPSTNYSQPYPQQYPQPGCDPSQTFAYPSYPMAPQSPMGEFGQQLLPGYYDLHPHMSTSPPPGYGAGMAGAYNTWNGGMNNAMAGAMANSMTMGGTVHGIPPRTFSPAQQGGPGYGGWFQGYGWSGIR